MSNDLQAPISDEFSSVSSAEIRLVLHRSRRATSTPRRSSRRSAKSPTTGASTPMCCRGAKTPPTCCSSPIRPRFRPAAATRRFSKPKTRRRVSTPSCNRTSATTGTASPIRFNMASAPIPASETKLWVEDTGRWFAGADGQAGARARRAPRHQRAPRARAQAHVSGALRRPDRRTEPPPPHRSSRRHDRRGAALSLVVRLSSGRDRQSGAHQRVLRLRHRRRSDPRSGQAPARPDARQGHARPFLRQ